MKQNNKLTDSAIFREARKRTIISLMKSGIRPDCICKIELDDIFKIDNKYFICLFDGENKNNETIFVRVKTKELTNYIRLWQSLTTKSEDKHLFSVGRSRMYELYKDYFSEKHLTMTCPKFEELGNTLGTNMPEDQFLIYLTSENYKNRENYFKLKIEKYKTDTDQLKSAIEDLENKNCKRAFIDALKKKLEKTTKPKVSKAILDKIYNLDNKLRSNKNESDVIPFKILIGMVFVECECGHQQISLFAFSLEEEYSVSFSTTQTVVQCLTRSKCSNCQKPLFIAGDPSIWDFFF